MGLSSTTAGHKPDSQARENTGEGREEKRKGKGFGFKGWARQEGKTGQGKAKSNAEQGVEHYGFPVVRTGASPNPTSLLSPEVSGELSLDKLQ